MNPQLLLLSFLIVNAAWAGKSDPFETQEEENPLFQIVHDLSETLERKELHRRQKLRDHAKALTVESPGAPHLITLAPDSTSAIHTLRRRFIGRDYDSITRSLLDRSFHELYASFEAEPRVLFLLREVWGDRRMTVTYGPHMEAFLHERPYLQSLALKEFTAHEVTSLLEMLSRNRHVRKIDLKCHRLGDGGLRSLLTHISVTGLPVTGLEDVDLTYNEITDAGLADLGNFLRTNETLKVLHLNMNEFTDEGARLLLEALHENKTLEEIHLNNHPFTDLSALALADLIKVNGVLRTICFSGNGVSDEGAKALGEALTKNGTLRILFLALNKITDQGAADLADALRENRSLTCLSMSLNDISNAGKSELQRAVEYIQTHHGRTLDLRL